MLTGVGGIHNGVGVSRNRLYVLCSTSAIGDGNRYTVLGGGIVSVSIAVVPVSLWGVVGSEHGHGLEVEGTDASHEGLLHVLLVEVSLGPQPGRFLPRLIQGALHLRGGKVDEEV